MKKTLLVFATLLIVISVSSFSYASEPSISAEAAILIDAKTGKVLFEKNAHQLMYPASTTKIMTGILTLENGNLEDQVVVDEETPYTISGSHIALEPDEIMSLNDLLHALLIQSANDSAVVIAKHLSGSVEEFAKLMNKKAIEVGAKNTNFVNPNGLPDENHVTTAYDLAMIAKYAMENEDFREIVGGYRYTIDPTNKKTEPRYLKSNNKLMYSTERINVNGSSVTTKYEGATGIKTGYTNEAGNCLISSASRNGQELIAVVLKTPSSNVFIDTHKLLNYGFDNFTTKLISFENEFIDSIKVEQGDRSYVAAIVGESIHAVVPKNSSAKIESKVLLPESFSAPISKNQVLGQIEYTLDGTKIGVANIISAVEVNQKPIYQAVDSNNSNFVLKKWWVWLIIAFIAWRIYISIKRSRRRRRKSPAFSYSSKSRNMY